VTKVSNRLSSVVAVENLLMRKLGLTTDVHIETADYVCCLKLFLNRLTEEQVELIRDLFKDCCIVNKEATITIA
jgi:hypothetical protein